MELSLASFSRGVVLLSSSLYCRDGGLKREKPKDSLRELQQDMYVNKQLKTD